MIRKMRVAMVFLLILSMLLPTQSIFGASISNGVVNTSSFVDLLAGATLPNKWVLSNTEMENEGDKIDKALLIRYKLSDIDSVVTAKFVLNIDFYAATEYVEVSLVDNGWTTADGGYSSVIDGEEILLVKTPDVGAAKANGSFINYDIPIDTSKLNIIKDNLSDDGTFSVLMRVKDSLSSTTVKGTAAQVGGSLMKLQYTDTVIAPAITGQEVLGTVVENFEISVHYDYDSTFYPEGNTEFSWWICDEADGTYEIIDGENSDTLQIETDYVGKYIKAKIIPHATFGEYSLGGEGNHNEYFTECVGPVKGISYLDELVVETQAITDAEELYLYLVDKEPLFLLGVDQFGSFNDDANKIMNNLLNEGMSTYMDLQKRFNQELCVVNIEKANFDEIESLLENEVLELDLKSFNNLAHKEAACEYLSNLTIESYSELQSHVDDAVIFAIIKTSDSYIEIGNCLYNNKDLFVFDFSEYTYAEILESGKYICELDRESMSDFVDIDAVLETALTYGRDNFNGGYINISQKFEDEVYVKTDFNLDSRGENIIAPPATQYGLFGNKNIENIKRHAFLKFNISQIPDYEIDDAKIYFYGTAGGGAGVKLSVYRVHEFEDSEDFIENNPYGSDIEFLENIGYCTFSYGTTGWSSFNITKFLSDMKEQNLDYAYLGLVFENAVGAVAPNSGKIYSQSMGGEHAPYVTVKLETPPLVKNITISGAKVVGETLVAGYDYYGCYPESETIYEWYAATKTGDEYTNITKISGADKKQLTVTSDISGKCVMVKIKPRTSGGAYDEGAFVNSGYTVPILGSTQEETLMDELNSIETSDDMYTYLNNEEKKILLDIEPDSDMSLLSTEGRTKVLQILADKDFSNSTMYSFRDYYLKMINVQKVNEASAEEIDSILQNSDIGIVLTRYNEYEDKSSIIDAIYNKSFVSVETFQKAFNEACAIKDFSTVNHSNVETLITWYDFMFTQDITDYTDDELELICNMFMTEIQNKRDTFANIQAALTSAINKADNYTPSIGNGTGSGSGSSSGGGGGGGFSVSVPPATNTVQPLTPVVNVFNDISSVETWAGRQIKKLYEQGIVEGDGNGAFRPNDTLTREEFVKMLVVAFDINVIGNFEYEDVSKDAWYYEYINRATAAGIVKGINDTSFGVGAKITREDMCTMLYRVLLNKNLLSEESKSIDFVDKSLIAEYALNAVDSLTSNGVVNGVGDNRFAPKDNATRAMAAVMICNALEIE